MRSVLSSVVLVSLVCSAAVAQRSAQPPQSDTIIRLLLNEGVQKELELTDAQKKAIAKADAQRKEASAKVFEDPVRKGAKKMREDFTQAMAKVQDGLKPAQKKRLLGIEVQFSAKSKMVVIFQNAAVQKALALTDEQKEVTSQFYKDVDELYEETKNDPKKSSLIYHAIRVLSSHAYSKVYESLDEKQLAAWKELQGEKFEVSRPKGGAKGKDRPEKPDDK